MSGLFPTVVIADFDEAAAQEVARSLELTRAESALAVGCDVADPASVETLIDQTVERFGGLDILVNNAGIYPMAPLAELDVDTFKRVLDVNRTGLFLCTKGAAEWMIARGRTGRIVNVTSIDALHPSMVGLSPLRRLQARGVGLHQERGARARTARHLRKRRRPRRNQDVRPGDLLPALGRDHRAGLRADLRSQPARAGALDDRTGRIPQRARLAAESLAGGLSSQPAPAPAV